MGKWGREEGNSGREGLNGGKWRRISGENVRGRESERNFSQFCTWKPWYPSPRIFIWKIQDYTPLPCFSTFSHPMQLRSSWFWSQCNQLTGHKFRVPTWLLLENFFLVFWCEPHGAQLLVEPVNILLESWEWSHFIHVTIMHYYRGKVFSKCRNIHYV